MRNRGERAHLLLLLRTSFLSSTNIDLHFLARSSVSFSTVGSSLLPAKDICMVMVFSEPVTGRDSIAVNCTSCFQKKERSTNSAPACVFVFRVSIVWV